MTTWSEDNAPLISSYASLSTFPTTYEGARGGDKFVVLFKLELLLCFEAEDLSEGGVMGSWRSIIMEYARDDAPAPPPAAVDFAAVLLLLLLLL